MPTVKERHRGSPFKKLNIIIISDVEEFRIIVTLFVGHLPPRRQFSININKKQLLTD